VGGRVEDRTGARHPSLVDGRAQGVVDLFEQQLGIVAERQPDLLQLLAQPSESRARLLHGTSVRASTGPWGLSGCGRSPSPAGRVPRWECAAGLDSTRWPLPGPGRLAMPDAASGGWTEPTTTSPMRSGWR